MESNHFGFLAIDKPLGLTSHDCVNRLRKVYGVKRIGHGGTLDPAVTGVLPIAIGKATRLLSFLPSVKKYEGTIQLGIRTTTNDLQGEIISEGSWPELDLNSLHIFLNKFKGDILQRPPDFSSIHIKGERAYKKARRGESFELPSRKITVHNLELLNWNEKTGKIDIEIYCSSGTYIRSIARDIGEEIGCGGALAKLRRTEALGFNIDEVIPLPIFNKEEPCKKPTLINPIKVLNHLPNIKIRKELELSHWIKGRLFLIQEDSFNTIINSKKKDLLQDEILVLNEEGSLIGIASWNKEDLTIQPKIVFNAAG
ncbi:MULTISPECIES: tRNA pseudouridine(55) synthase TruB [unclassified Prochlorococcus]|uniref:tRNA pseudouridine(55) synthase TruB n=1 Tax=unclassified Prochlorococcus TaxID=2627481 RepID=UPI000533898E|nr:MULTISPECIES: tRNA pseudouridine(55) synthase TruB [unclassified Prochlorococcus]KGG16210.1 tRNA pseudouridine synthase B [Prochlorococcus sp. MIT 0603]KGG18055.1 tRNA pseudouridine synthase B [Prochlorococcus sp. MIT 0602]